jgi:hypothetical protein
MPLYFTESHVNRDTNTRYYESDAPQEVEHGDVGRLYKSLRNEYGRCTGKVHVDCRARPGDRDSNEWIVKDVGWVFVKRVEYDPGDRRGKSYLREVWITLYEMPEIVERKRTYFDLAKRNRPRRALTNSSL